MLNFKEIAAATLAHLDRSLVTSVIVQQSLYKGLDTPRWRYRFSDVPVISSLTAVCRDKESPAMELYCFAIANKSVKRAWADTAWADTAYCSLLLHRKLVCDSYINLTQFLSDRFAARIPNLLKEVQP